MPTLDKAIEIFMAQVALQGVSFDDLRDGEPGVVFLAYDGFNLRSALAAVIAAES